MAVLRVQSPEDFKKVLEMNCDIATHVIMTDEISYVAAVPVVTSAHRHYIILEADEEALTPLIEELRKRGYKVVKGKIEFRG